MTLKNLGKITDAFTSFLEGFGKCTVQKQDEKTDFIIEAVMLLLQLQGIAVSL